MGLLDQGQMAAQYTISKNGKKAAKQQAALAAAAAQREAAAQRTRLTASERQAQFESQMIEHMRYQSDTLAAIRDLLIAQQTPPPTTAPPE